MAKSAYRFVVICLAFALLAGISLAGTSPSAAADQRAEAKPPSGGEKPASTAEVSAKKSPTFSQALADEYAKFIVFEDQKYQDDFDINHFTGKAERAAGGQTVLPDDVTQYSIPGARSAALTEARARLVGALDKDARTAVPALAAKTQVKFDCWISRQGAEFTDDDIIVCRNDFFIALGWLEESVIPIPAGSDFTKTLAREYLAYADFEATQFKDWIDSRYFARKGLRAANANRDTDVLPEFLPRWNLTVDQEVPQYVKARKRLVSALDAGARKTAPVDAAVAQARFDCWVERTSEHGDKDFVEKCRREFFAALDKIEKREKPVATRGEAGYIIYFNFDKSFIRTDQKPKVSAASADIQKTNPQTINIVGHTDRAGSDGYNMALSLRRADAVREALVLAGIGAGRIKVIARGESKLRVPTKDGIREQENRRAEILFR